LPKGADNNVMVTFKRSDNSVLGALVLSPEQPSIKNFTYRLGDQKIHIQGIQLGLPVYERSMGSVVINCKISDGNGRNTERYKGMIASWPYK
ncbi:MAG TPA: hypothetical protein VJC18_10015, partial [bacterium]|nr:hypothetical protein [bacterium]